MLWLLICVLTRFQSCPRQHANDVVKEVCVCDGVLMCQEFAAQRKVVKKVCWMAWRELGWRKCDWEKPKQGFGIGKFREMCC